MNSVNNSGSLKLPLVIATIFVNESGRKKSIRIKILINNASVIFGFGISILNSLLCCTITKLHKI